MGDGDIGVVSWEKANSHQQTCFTTSTIANDDELSADLSHGY
jgi:hypothetical protein